MQHAQQMETNSNGECASLKSTNCTLGKLQCSQERRHEKESEDRSSQSPWICHHHGRAFQLRKPGIESRSTWFQPTKIWNPPSKNVKLLRCVQVCLCVYSLATGKAVFKSGRRRRRRI